MYGALYFTRLLSDTIVRLSCGHEYDVCLAVAKSKFDQWLANPASQRFVMNSSFFIYNVLFLLIIY